MTGADPLSEQRLTDLERLGRGLSHEANNWLYTILGQTELAEQHLRTLAVAVRYLTWRLGRAERAGVSLTPIVPPAMLASVRLQTASRVSRRRLAGLRKARRNAEQLARALQALHVFAAARATVTSTVDVNAAVRAGLELLHLAYHRHRAEPLDIDLDLAEGLLPALGSAGLVSGIIIDLASSADTARVRVATRHDGEAITCAITIAPPDERGYPPALAAARLCGGRLAVDRGAAATTFVLWLATSGPAMHDA